jgi:non-heme Fe2+,alpha-ketoglutarate-dependent halogenase
MRAVANVLRCGLFLGLAVTFYLLRRLKFMHWALPGGVREALRIWTDPMLRVPLKSLGRRVYVDEPCGFVIPRQSKPLASAAPEYRLTAEEVRAFHERGFLGPFRVIPEHEATELREHIEGLLAKDSPTYGFRTTRDRHLDSPRLMELLCHPAIVERVKQLMGPDLMVWRSNVFEKRAGSPEITWHQGTTFLLEQAYKPALEPADKGDMFEIAIWMAIDDANAANGCMQVVPGSHTEIGTIRLNGTKQFLDARFEGDYKINPKDLVSLPCRPGEFVIFTERLIHGSEPNRSPNSRMSFVFRFVKPDCRVYRDETSHFVFSMKKRFPLDRWAAVLVHGEDHYGHNRIVRPEEVFPAEAVRV